jgi:hypothetical protein
MSNIIDFIDIEVSQEYVDRVKSESIQWKQNLGGDIKTRYSGKLGEEAFRIYCNQMNMQIKDLTHGFSWTDFVLGDKYIDIKTVATSVYPTIDYACNISAKQFENNKVVNTYVFARYIKDSPKVILLGWVTKHEFEINALLRRTGDNVTNSFTSNVEFMELEIKYLNPMSSLISP